MSKTVQNAALVHVIVLKRSYARYVLVSVTPPAVGNVRVVFLRRFILEFGTRAG